MSYQISRPQPISLNMSDWLKYSSIARAGVQNNLTGDAIVEIGAGIAQIADEFTPEKIEDVNKEQDSKEQDSKKPTDGEVFEDDKSEDEKFNTNTVEVAKINKRQDDIPKTTSDPKPKNEQVGSNIGLTTGPNLTEISVKTGTTSPTTLDIFTDSLSNSIGIDNVFNMPFSGADINKKSPFDRKLTEALKGFAYPYLGTEFDTPLRRAAHYYNSPVLKTDDVKFGDMQRIVAPGYTGSIGSAFAEGFNIVADRYNYNQKVKRDFEQEVDEQMSGLTVDVDQVNELYRKDILELSSTLKKDLYNDYVDYAKGDISKIEYENRKLAYQDRINKISQANNNLNTLDKEFYENKHLYDVDASNSDILDFYNTREKAPENITIKQIDGQYYYTGKTINDKDFKISVDKMANGTAGLRLVEKANLNPITMSVVKGMKSIQEDAKTKFGYGVSNLSPDDPRLKSFALAQISASLDDENVLRSAASQLRGIGYDAYNQAIKDSDDRVAFRNQLANEFYEEIVKPTYMPESKTTRFEQKQTQQRLTASERNRIQLNNMIGSLPNPTEDNFNQYKSFIDTKYDYKIKDGKLLIGLKGKKKDEISLSDPNFKSNFSRFVKLPAFTGQQQTYDAASLIKKYSN